MSSLYVSLCLNFSPTYLKEILINEVTPRYFVRSDPGDFSSAVNVILSWKFGQFSPGTHLAVLLIVSMQPVEKIIHASMIHRKHTSKPHPNLNRKR